MLFLHFQHCLLDCELLHYANYLLILIYLFLLMVFFLLIYSPKRLICVDYKLADHPHFMRSKARASNKMTNSDGLGLVTVSKDEPETLGEGDVTFCDEKIALMMQQIADMQSEINRLQNLTKLSISTNTPLPEHGINSTISSSCPLIYSPASQHLPPNPPLH